MNEVDAAAWRAIQSLQAAGVDDAEQWVALLQAAGLGLIDRTAGTMACRWVPVTERAVPPEADTIIRTITRTDGDQTSVRTYWLDGLRGPLTPR